MPVRRHSHERDARDVGNARFATTACKTACNPLARPACPTQSIQFGKLDDLKKRAATRVEQLHEQGVKEAALYGADDAVLGGLNSFYLLLDKPETYGLPSNPKLPSSSVPSGSLWSVAAAFLTMLGMLFAFRERGRVEQRAGSSE